VKEYVTTGPMEVATSLDTDGTLQIYIDVDSSCYLWVSREEATKLARHLVDVFKLCPSEIEKP
jgi:hypothetical protein